MIDSKQLIEVTGISRATLNNYVVLGILPSPQISAPLKSGDRATRLGFFPDEAVDRIKKVQMLKKRGLSMAEIARQCGNTFVDETVDEIVESAVELPAMTERFQSEQTSQNATIELSVDSFPGPAYMVNNNFELIWWNESAIREIFRNADLSEGESRNLLKLLLASVKDSELRDDYLADILKPHLAAAKKRMDHSAVSKLFCSIDDIHLPLLEKLNSEVQSVGKDAIVHFDSLYFDQQGKEVAANLYVSLFREGILFSYSPVKVDDADLLRFLSRRNHVTQELIKRRKPQLSHVAVLVADLQDSVRICSELPPEEYFELINTLWQESEPIFRKYYGTYGKHVGDGMVYFFFPQPDCDYVSNAIHCAAELKEMMRRITLRWQSRKGWFNDMHLNIGMHEGQEWFGTFAAGAHFEFTVLGETVNYASRISDFAREGSIWVSKSMLSKLPVSLRKQVHYGINQRTAANGWVFVSEMYSSIQHLSREGELINPKFREIEMMPVAEIRGLLEK